MATKGKDKILNGQITFEFFMNEKQEVKNRKTKQKQIIEKKLKPIKLKHVKSRKMKQ